MSINEIYRKDKHEDIPNPLSSCSRAPLTPSSLVRRPPAALSTAITVFTHFRNKQKHISNTTSTLRLLARPFFPRTADNHQQTARRNNVEAMPAKWRRSWKFTESLHPNEVQRDPRLADAREKRCVFHGLAHPCDDFVAIMYWRTWKKCNMLQTACKGTLREQLICKKWC